MGQWMSVDYGARRIGVAIADQNHRIAFPTDTLPATGSAPKDAAAILSWARDHNVSGVVVGLPMNMDGSIGPQGRLCQTLADRLRRAGQVHVELWDERLSSYQADIYMEQASVRRSRRKGLRDALAAQVILQSFLDARQPGEPPTVDPGPPPESADQPNTN
jgi:putative Holliday junction resolvase